MEWYTVDIEVLKNMFLAVVIDMNEFLNYTKNVDNLSINEKIEVYRSVPTKKYIVYDDYNNLFEFVSFINKRQYIITFNGLDYDDIIIKLIISKIQYWKTNKQILRDIYEISQRAVRSGKYEIKDDLVNYLKWSKSNFLSVDIQKVFGLNKIKKSLKQTLINVKWFNIEDYSMPKICDKDSHFYKDIPPELYNTIPLWERYIIKDYIPGFIKYCTNDVLGTCEIVRVKLDAVGLRINSSIKYQVNLLSSSESNMADRIFAKLYCDLSGIPMEEYLKGRTYWKYINVKDCISNIITFKTEPYKKLFKELKELTITQTKKEVDLAFKDKGTTYSIKSGGLHSEDKPKVYKENDEFIYRDADVTSFYPFIVINNKFHPKHLNRDIFINTTSRIVYDRVNAKKEKDKITADTLKIVINSGVFGKMGYEFSPVFDRKAMVSVTFTGQLALLMLIEDINLEDGLTVISANTDGIVTKIRRDKEQKYIDICNTWSKYTKFNLEYTDYELYIRKNVNNYFCLKSGNSPLEKRIKAKGELNPNTYKEDLRKGFNYPIVSKSVIDYFLHGIPIIDTINNCKDIFLFCSTMKPNEANFNMEYHTIKNGKLFIYGLTKNNRYYVCNKGGVLLKNRRDVPGDPGNYNIKGKYCKVLKGYNVSIFNEAWDTDNFSDYDINYGFYYNKARSIINSIKTSQTNNRIIRKNLDQLNLF
jgi:hypothetical protein